MSKLKDRAITAVLLVLLALVVTSIFFLTQVKRHWNEFVFTYNHPQLVNSLRVSYATESAKLEDKLMKHEKSAEDQLIESVADQVKLGK